MLFSKVDQNFGVNHSHIDSSAGSRMRTSCCYKDISSFSSQMGMKFIVRPYQSPTSVSSEYADEMERHPDVALKFRKSVRQ